MQDFKMSGGNMNELLTNGDNPVQQAIDALKSHGDRVDDFYDEFQEYKDMEDM